MTTQSMRSNETTAPTDRKSVLSTLWIFVLLNVIFRDIHEFFRPGLIQEILSGTVGGNVMTQDLLLVAAIVLEIPIAMVLLSRVLKQPVNRWTNIIAGAVTILTIIANRPGDLDDIFFAAVEIVGLAGIVWYAWTWREPASSVAAIRASSASSPRVPG